MTRQLLILPAAIAALAVLGSPVPASAATTPAATASPAVKKYFAVFRRPKTRKDTIRTKPGDKRARARVSGSRLVATASGFKAYLVPSGSQVCIWLIQPTGAATGCAGLTAIRSTSPPALFKIGAKTVITVIPMPDGITSVTRTGADGATAAKIVRNNVYVDVSAGGGSIDWSGPSGPVSVRIPGAGSL